MSKKIVNKIKVPEGWKYIPFGDVFEFIQTVALSREQLTLNKSDNIIYNIHYGDIHATYNSNILDFEKEVRIPKIIGEVEIKPSIFLKDGDLAIADASEDYEGVASNVEIININGKKATGGLHTFIARDNSGFTEKGFRSYVLKNPIVANELKKLATGSKVYGISKTNLASLFILLPTNREQKLLAKIFHTWNKCIETLEDLIARKVGQKQAIVKQLLQQQQRFREFNKDKWKPFLIKELFDLKAGKDIQPDEYSEFETREHKFPVYSNTLENHGLYGYYKSFQFDAGLITVTARGDIGHANARYEKFNAMGRLLILIPTQEINIKFVSEYINHCLNIFVESTGVPQLTAPQFGSYSIEVPSIEHQNKIASVITTIDEEIKKLKVQLIHVKQQKKGIMRLLLTGKKRMK